MIELQELKMPIYEFKCLECNNIFEILFGSSNEKVEIKCPECGSREAERVLSTVSVAVKGSASENTPTITQKSCSGGTCATLTLPGHTR